MKNIIKALIFALIFMIILSILNKIFSPVGSNKGGWYVTGATRDMYKQDDNTVDVLYLGNSNVFAGVSPLEIYERLGVTGFSASTPAQDVIGSYHTAIEFFKKQSPKVVMIETSEFFTKKEQFIEIGTRSEIEYMNFGLNKLNMINEEYFGYSIKEKMSFIFPVFRYHDRYQRLTEFDLRKIIQKTELSYKGYLYDKRVNKFKDKGQKNYQKYL